MTNPAETQAELVTGALLVFVVALYLLRVLGATPAMLLGGLVLLGSGVYQTRRGWHVALTTWLVGLLLFMGGIGVRMYLVAALPINFVAIGLLLIGAFMLFGAFRRRS